MTPLDVRKVRILQSVVHDYVQTTRPVGSERLIEVYQLGCKSATVRNEMAEMVEMGYLIQPHTSAGRIPTNLGYRYYVNELMRPPNSLASEEANSIQSVYQQTPNEVEDILLQTCRILSGLTSSISIATDPSTATTTLRHVYLAEASPRFVLLVALLSTGHVEHRLVELETTLNATTLTLLSNYLNVLFADHDLDEIGHWGPLQDAPAELLAFTAPLTKLFALMVQTALTLSERRVFLDGTKALLRQPEFQEVTRLEMILHALEQRNTLYQILSSALLGESITIVIGTENTYEPMQECSIISTAYYIGSRPAGYLGVVGPTRMDYDRAYTAVGLMAQNLSHMLTNLSLA